MIRSFKDKDTEAIFNGSFVRRIPKQVAPLAARKLNQIHAAGCLDDLRIPPGNRLEALKGDRKGQHSIRSTTSGESVFAGRKRGQMLLKLWIITSEVDYGTT